MLASVGLGLKGSMLFPSNHSPVDGTVWLLNHIGNL